MKLVCCEAANGNGGTDTTPSGIKEMDSNYIELMNKNGNRFFISFFCGWRYPESRNNPAGGATAYTQTAIHRS